MDTTIDEAVDALKNIPEINRSYCRRWAEKNFSREKMVEDYIQVYTSILQKQPSYR